MNWNPIDLDVIKYSNKQIDINNDVFNTDINVLNQNRDNIYNQIKNGETLEEFMSKTIYD